MNQITDFDDDCNWILQVLLLIIGALIVNYPPIKNIIYKLGWYKSDNNLKLNSIGVTVNKADVLETKLAKCEYLIHYYKNEKDRLEKELGELVEGE